MVNIYNLTINSVGMMSHVTMLVYLYKKIINKVFDFDQQSFLFQCVVFFANSLNLISYDHTHRILRGHQWYILLGKFIQDLYLFSCRSNIKQINMR